MHPHWTRSELVASALGYAGKNENDSPEAEPEAPRGRSRINLRRIAHRIAQFATGDLVEQPLASRFAPAIGMTAEPIQAVHRIAVPEPAFDLGDALLNSRIADVDFRDPVRLDLQLIDIRAGEDERVVPHAKMAPLFLTEVWFPFLRQAPPIPLTDGEFVERLFDFHVATTTATSALFAKIRRVADMHGANEFEQCEEHVFVGALFRLGSEDVEATPAALNRFVERGADVASPPQVAQLAAESEEMFVEVVLCVEHDVIGGG